MSDLLNPGLQLLGPLKSDDPRVIIATLFVRAWKNLDAGVYLATRGFYTQAVTLIRSAHEDSVHIWAFGRNFQEIFRKFKNGKNLPQARAMNQARRDAYESEGDVNAVSDADRWTTVWEESNNFTHPNYDALALEIDSSARIQAGPIYDHLLARRCLNQATEELCTWLVDAREFVRDRAKEPNSPEVNAWVQEVDRELGYIDPSRDGGSHSPSEAEE